MRPKWVQNKFLSQCLGLKLFNVTRVYMGTPLPWHSLRLTDGAHRLQQYQSHTNSQLWRGTGTPLPQWPEQAQGISSVLSSDSESGPGNTISLLWARSWPEPWRTAGVDLGKSTRSDTCWRRGECWAPGQAHGSGTPSGGSISGTLVGSPCQGWQRERHGHETGRKPGLPPTGTYWRPED